MAGTGGDAHTNGSAGGGGNVIIDAGIGGIALGTGSNGTNGTISIGTTTALSINSGSGNTSWTHDGNLIIESNLTVDTNTLLVDSINNRVGIGTISPEEKLHVSGGKILLDNDQGIRAKTTGGTVRDIILAGGDDSLAFGSLGNGYQFYNEGLSSVLVRISEGGNVGIGTTTPSYKLEVAGNTSLNSTFFVNTNGRVGIGRANPTRLLDVHAADAAYITISDNSQERLLIGYTEGESFDGGVQDDITPAQILVDTQGDLHLSSRTNFASDVVFYSSNGSNGIERMRIKDSGNVGIGTITPTYLLEVDGNVSLNNTLFITSAGDVGIGTSSPVSKLDVNGTLTLQPTSSIATIQTNNTNARLDFIADRGESTLIAFKFRDAAGNSALDILDNGNIGIGTLSPTQKLEVSGTTNITNNLFVGENISIGGASLSDLTIVQGSSNKGITLTGQGISGSQVTDGLSMLVGNNAVGNMQLWICQQSDLVTAADNCFRYTLGIDVPNIGGVNVGNSINRNINFIRGVPPR